MKRLRDSNFILLSCPRNPRRPQRRRRRERRQRRRSKAILRINRFKCIYFKNQFIFLFFINPGNTAISMAGCMPNHGITPLLWHCSKALPGPHPWRSQVPTWATIPCDLSVGGLPRGDPRLWGSFLRWVVAEPTRFEAVVGHATAL